MNENKEIKYLDAVSIFVRPTRRTTIP